MTTTYSIEITLKKRNNVPHDAEAVFASAEALGNQGFAVSSIEQSESGLFIVIDSNDPVGDLELLKRLMPSDTKVKDEIRILDSFGWELQSGDWATVFNLRELEASRRKVARKRQRDRGAIGSFYRFAHKPGEYSYLKYLAEWIPGPDCGKEDIFVLLDLSRSDVACSTDLELAPRRWAPFCANLDVLLASGLAEWASHGIPGDLKLVPPFRESFSAGLFNALKGGPSAPMYFEDWEIWSPSGGRQFVGTLPEECRTLEFKTSWMPLGLARRIVRNGCDYDLYW
jgi:hypothetical protein